MWRTARFHFRSFVVLDYYNDLPLFLGDAIRSVDLYTDDTNLYAICLDKDMLENNL